MKKILSVLLFVLAYILGATMESIKSESREDKLIGALNISIERNNSMEMLLMKMITNESTVQSSDYSGGYDYYYTSEPVHVSMYRGFVYSGFAKVTFDCEGFRMYKYYPGYYDFTKDNEYWFKPAPKLIGPWDLPDDRY